MGMLGDLKKRWDMWNTWVSWDSWDTGTAFQQRSAIRKHTERHNLSIYLNYAFAAQYPAFFSKIVEHGQNTGLNFNEMNSLRHSSPVWNGVGQDWDKAEW